MYRVSFQIKVFIFVIFLLMISCLTSSCNKNQISDDNKNLSIAVGMFPSSFDPRCPQNISDKTILINMFEGLLKEREDENSFEYALAKNVEISKDNLTYVFELKDTYWSNGEPITAHDLKESWIQILSPNFPSPSPKILDGIKNAVKVRKGDLPLSSLGISVPEKKILRIELERPYPNFLKLTSSPLLFPVHKSIRDSYSSPYPINEIEIEKLISSGPFSIEKYIPDKYLILKKNDHYYDKRMINLENLHFFLISSPHTAYLMFKNKNIGWLGQPFTIIQREALGEIKARDQLKNFNVYGTTWLLCNSNSQTLNNIKIRKALSFSIDRASIVAGLLQSQQSPTTKIIPNPFQSNHPSFFGNYDCDKEEAKKLFHEGLAESGMRTKDCHFRFSYPTNPPRYGLIAQVICENWRSVLGIEVYPIGIDSRTLHENIEDKKFDITIGCRIPPISDATHFLEIFDTNQYLSSLLINRVQFQKLLEKIQEEHNYYEKSKLIKYAEHLLEKEYNVIPLYNISFDFALNQPLTGFRSSPSGTVDFKNAEIK